MRVLVCGGRTFGVVPEHARLEQLRRAEDQRIWLRRTLDNLREPLGISEIIHGGANGADRLAGEWARDRGLAVTVFLADWTRHGKRAGPIRNNEMLKRGRPHAVVVFPGGPGTRDMLKRATKFRPDYCTMLEIHTPVPPASIREP